MAKDPPSIPSSEITSERDHSARARVQGPPDPDPDDPDLTSRGRRSFLRNVTLAGAGAAVFGGGLYAVSKRRGAAPAPPTSALAPLPATSSSSGLSAVALAKDDALTKIEDVTTYNNFYEFGLSKSDPAESAGTLRTRPWTIKIEGEVHKPQEIGIDDLIKRFPLEERVYRMRCVEAWSMVIPWLGFQLGKLIDHVQPTTRAKYVALTTLHDPEQMPGQRSRTLPWPYVEGLRIDEAMNPLTLLVAGLYGRTLPNQNGAPLRLIVPWKYGFKGIKSIVSIKLVETVPVTTWNEAAPGEYGFFANVNPHVDHPRWSQASERRIGDLGRRPTLMFNGYAEQVAHLYEGMNLEKNY